jgi:tRNA(fMet)-specific endonuclease VapC
MRYLLDTNILSQPTRPEPAPRVIDLLHTHRGQIAAASPVWHELRYGVQRLPPSHRRQQLTRYLDALNRSTLPILPYDGRAAEWHASQRARLERLGRTPAFVDGQIAAIARTNGLVLVTSNTSDFEAFEDLELEDWARG